MPYKIIGPPGARPILDPAGFNLRYTAAAGMARVSCRQIIKL